MGQPLLTIAIPTYNRAGLLDICINSISSQLVGSMRDDVELIVVDNHSKDNTTDVVTNYINNGCSVEYVKNPENIGADRNFALCFRKAKGKYVWIFSDDDLLRDGYLKLILNLLKSNDFGNLYLNSLSFTGTYNDPDAVPATLNYTKYSDPLQFVDQVNYYFTFITANIVNKSLLTNIDYISDFYDTNLVQLSWSLPTIFAAKQNVIINDQVVACLANNTGGYKLFKVFGENFNKLMDYFISKKQFEKRAKVIINNHLLRDFFPMFMFNKTFKAENPLKRIIPIYWNYSSFWKTIFPPLFKRYINSKLSRS